MIKTLDDFIREYTKIVNNGPVKTHREGNTGIGKTLEDLLGIEENNDQLPDFGDYELKSHRKNASSMITLITKSPDGEGTNRQILEEYGYYVDGKKKLHMSLQYGVWVETKDKRHSLSIDADDDSVFVIDETHKKVCSWSTDTIKRVIQKKYKSTKVVHALAYSEKVFGEEYFTFVEAFLADGVSGEKIIQAVKDGVIIVDLRIGTYTSGKPHDHGTGFRIKPANQFDFYEHIVDLVGNYVKEWEKNKK